MPCNRNDRPEKERGEIEQERERKLLAGIDEHSDKGNGEVENDRQPDQADHLTEMSPRAFVRLADRRDDIEPVAHCASCFALPRIFAL